MQENREKFSNVEESELKGTAFGQHTDLFRESLGLPYANAITEKNSDNEKSEVISAIYLYLASFSITFTWVTIKI